MKFTSFLTDREKEVSGVWFTITPSEPDEKPLKLRIARITSPAYENALQKLSQPYAVSSSKGKLPINVMNELVCQAASHHILIDWDGLEDEQGAPIPYSQPKAYELLTASTDFMRMVIEFAANVENYRRKAAAETTGN